MRLIKPSYEILKSKNTLKDIEIAARNCYKSEDKITEDNSSAIQIVDNLIKRGHYAMLEFGTNKIFEIKYNKFFDNFIRSGLTHELKYINISYTNERTLISFNPRTALEIYNKIKYNSSDFGKILLKVISETFEEFIKETDVSCFYTDEIIEIFDEELTDYEKFIHKTVTVRFICNRGISHQIVRHRETSIAQESTRYNNYTKGKFGGDVTFIAPSWLELESWIGKSFNTGEVSAYFYSKVHDKNFWFLKDCAEVDYKYSECIRRGGKPDRSRGRLSEDTKTEVIVKATLQEWYHIFDLRCDSHAHEQIRELMIPLREEFKSISF